MSIEREKGADRTITDCVAKRADATRGALRLWANEGGELSRPSGNREGPLGWDEVMEFRLANRSRWSPATQQRVAAIEYAARPPSDCMLRQTAAAVWSRTSRTLDVSSSSANGLCMKCETPPPELKCASRSCV